MSSQLKVSWVWLILLMIGLLVYAGSFDNHFVWDDEEQVVNNQVVHSLKNWPQFFGGSTFNTGGAAQGMSGMYYKPLMSLSFAFIYSLAGPRPFCFHLFQTALHIFNAGLVFLFFKTLFSRVKSFAGQDWLSLGLSLIFLVHPINVETVVYISSLQDVLSFTFGLGASLIVLRKKLEFKWLAALFFGLLFSLLAKETGVVWLLFIPILSWLVSEEKEWRRWSLTASGASFLIYLFLRLGVAQVGFHSSGVSPMIRLSFRERLWSMPKIIWHYLATYFWPAQLAIAEHWVVLVTKLNVANFYGPLIFTIILGISLLSLGIRWLQHLAQEKAAISLVFVSLLMLGLGLHLQIFPLDMTVADRWFYLPQLGVLGLLGLVWFRGQKALAAMSKKSIQFGLLALIIIALGGRSMVRVKTWQSGLVLYAHDVQLELNSFDLTNNYGVELYRAGDKEKAKKYFQRSTELAPHWWTNWNNLGVLLEEEGQIELAAEYYQKAIDHGQYFLAYQNLARVRVEQDPAAGLKFTEESLKLLPYNAKLHYWRQVATEKLEAD